MLTTLDRIRMYMGITDNADDAVLQMLGDAVSARIERYCNREFNRQTYTETIEAHQAEELMLSQYPLVAVTSVMGDNGPVTDYVIHPTGTLRRPGGWDGTYTVTYSAGYDDIPLDLELACLLLVSYTYNLRGSEHLKTEITGPLRSDFWADWPGYIIAMLDKYRRPVRA